MNREIFFLEGLSRYSDYGLLIMRALTGAFLIYGVVDNVVSLERMREFAEFMKANGFMASELMAPLSVYFQLIAGIALVLGLFTRWVGILIALHFIVAIIMVHWSETFRGWWPAVVLVGIGLQFTFTGAGSISLDRLLTRGKNALAP